MAELREIDRPAIAAEGVLADLPFDMLPTTLPRTEPRRAKNYSAFSWLGMRFAIGRLTKTSPSGGIIANDTRIAEVEPGEIVCVKAIMAIRLSSSCPAGAGSF